jgi:hypothetical protein
LFGIVSFRSESFLCLLLFLSSCAIGVDAAGQMMMVVRKFVCGIESTNTEREWKGNNNGGGSDEEEEEEQG